MKRNFFLCLIALFLSCQLVAAHDSDRPIVAFLSFGTSPLPYSATEGAILQQLHNGGWLSAAEYDSIDARGEIEGERVTILALDAGWKMDRLNIMVETALDREANILVALTTPVAQAAVNITLEMDDPPYVIFGSVFHPIQAGLIDSLCIKPSHVTGSQIVPSYEQLIALVKMQQPDVSKIGTIFSADQISGVFGARDVENIATELGIENIQAAVTHPIDFIAAVDGLVSRGAEALLLTIDTVTSHGLPVVVATASENGIPVYYPSLGGVATGAMITAGNYRQNEQGVNLGRLVRAALSGELDVESTSIGAIGGDAVGVNLGIAEALDLEIVPSILDDADVIIHDEDVTLSDRLQEAMHEQYTLITTENRESADRAYLDSLTCTPEMIAEQQAALDAAAE